ncbi:shikimate kinase, partial [Rhizobium ruizarguesonis]
GAFINDRTRKHIKKGGLSVWLKADLDVLWDWVAKRDTRPLLKTENPKQTLEGLEARGDLGAGPSNQPRPDQDVVGALAERHMHRSDGGGGGYR